MSRKQKVVKGIIKGYDGSQFQKKYDTIQNEVIKTVSDTGKKVHVDGRSLIMYNQTDEEYKLIQSKFIEQADCTNELIGRAAGAGYRSGHDDGVKTGAIVTIGIGTIGYSLYKYRKELKELAKVQLKKFGLLKQNEIEKSDVVIDIHKNEEI